MISLYLGTCETLCEMELCEQFKQSAQALELLHERKMWNEQKPCCLSAASLRFMISGLRGPVHCDQSECLSKTCLPFKVVQQ